jgi:hypothetical protein
MKSIITLVVTLLLGCQLQAQVVYKLSSSPNVGSGPTMVAVADVNGDGRKDLICVNYYGPSVSVLTNNGGSGFVPSGTYSVGAYPTAVTTADVNGNGKMDIITANSGSAASSLSVLTNNGSGGFVLSGTHPVGTEPAWVTAADVNGDGKMDLISANWGSFNGNTLTVLTNNGSGGFVLSSSPVVGLSPMSVAAVDVNGDGKIDLVSANRADDSISVLTNNGSGGFVLAGSNTVGYDPVCVAATDVNGDGKVDLIAANWGRGSGSTLTVLTNNGSSGFVLSSTPTVGSGSIAVATGDVNGDGKVDLVSANLYSSTFSILTNNGVGGFGLATNLPVGPNPNSVTAADVNGDGKVDLISPNSGNSTLSVMTNATVFPCGPVAKAVAFEIYGFTVNVTVTCGGSGYTNTPSVHFLGGGGDGAQAVATVSNGVVTAIQVLDAGFGYTNAPLVILDPPFIPNPVLGIKPISFLTFSNLSPGSTYQLQRMAAQGSWTNQSGSLTATNAFYTVAVPGGGFYRLTLAPAPAQAFATAQLLSGFVIGATVTSPGSGYVGVPAVTIVGGGGSGATAVAQISAGAVTNIAITATGGGYTSLPTIQIDPPPATALAPAVVPGMQLNSTNLIPYFSYQLQFTPALPAGWASWDGTTFSPTVATNSQSFVITNSAGFFRLQYLGIP